MPRASASRLLARALAAARRANHADAGLPPPVAAALRIGRRGAVLGAAAALAPWPARAEAAPERGRRDRVAIIGGGLAGLAAAWHLKQAGITADVYEAAGRLGGRVFTETDRLGRGLVLELGGELINTTHADMLRLIDAFGLGPLFDRRRDAKRVSGVPAALYLFGGERVAEDRLARRLRPLAARIAADAAQVDRDFDRFAPAIDALSVADYLDAGPEPLDPAARALIEAGIRTEYGVEPQQSSALQLIYNFPVVDGVAVEPLGNSDERFSLPGGNGRLIAALAAALPAQVHLNRQLTAILPDGEDHRLEFADGTAVLAGPVIVTLPFPVLRGVRIGVPLGRRLREAISTGALGQNEKVFAGFASRVWRQPAGFAGEAWTDLGFAEVWDATQRQADRPHGALNFYLGGAEVGRAEAGAAIEGPRFLRRLGAFIPGIEEAANGRFRRTRWGRDPLIGGAYSTVPPGALTGTALFWAERRDGRIVSDVRDGGLWFAGEHLSDAHYGFMNGAVETGRMAATSVVGALTRP
jgi:monoamine oxidase